MNRKRLSDLSETDMIENQIWEYCLENNIEYVSASTKTEITEGNNMTHIVVTDFIFNNKTRHIGYCSPQGIGGLDNVQPVVFYGKGQVEFYKENDWTENDKAKALLKLGLNFNEVFPLVYHTRVKCDRKIFSGILTNFNKEEETYL